MSNTIEYVINQIGGGTPTVNASDVVNDSAVTGANVDDALNTLQAAIGGGGGSLTTYVNPYIPGSPIARRFDERLGEEIYPFEFGAVGDGITDDTAAFNTMFDYVERRPSGVTVNLGIGWYKLTSQLTCTAANRVRITSNGALILIDWAANGSGGAITLNQNGYPEQRGPDDIRNTFDDRGFGHIIEKVSLFGTWFPGDTWLPGATISLVGGVLRDNSSVPRKGFVKAELRHYSTGTVAVTNGSNIVVGTGTNFNTDLVAGDFIRFQGHTKTYRVNSVPSATSMTIGDAFTGATATGLQYRAGNHNVKAYRQYVYTAAGLANRIPPRGTGTGISLGGTATANYVKDLNWKGAVTVGDTVLVGDLVTMQLSNLEVIAVKAGGKINGFPNIAADFLTDSKYRSGTANVTNGSAVVTGNSTLFTSFVAVGDYFAVPNDQASGYYTIQSVDSDTQITLTTPYTGTTNATASYNIGEVVFSYVGGIIRAGDDAFGLLGNGNAKFEDVIFSNFGDTVTRDSRTTSPPTIRQTGTVSITQGTRILTGSGTNWSAELLANDFVNINQDPRAYRIATVDSSTQITLTEDYVAATVAAAPYTGYRVSSLYDEGGCTHIVHINCRAIDVFSAHSSTPGGTQSVYIMGGHYRVWASMKFATRYPHGRWGAVSNTTIVQAGDQDCIEVQSYGRIHLGTGLNLISESRKGSAGLNININSQGDYSIVGLTINGVNIEGFTKCIDLQGNFSGRVYGGIANTFLFDYAIGLNFEGYNATVDFENFVVDKTVVGVSQRLNATAVRMGNTPILKNCDMDFRNISGAIGNSNLDWTIAPSSTNNEIYYNGVGTPSLGTHVIGEHVHNRNATAGQVLISRCVANGSAGTWKDLIVVPV